MKSWHHFYRSGYACAVEKDKSTDEYIGHIGFPENHKLYKSRFAKVCNVNLYYMINDWKFNNKSLDELWWLSFKPPGKYSYDKQVVVDALKSIVDNLSKSTTSVADTKKEPDKDKGFKLL